MTYVIITIISNNYEEILEGKFEMSLVNTGNKHKNCLIKRRALKKIIRLYCFFS